jgi:hypothetical protein
LEFLGLHFSELLRVRGLQVERIEADITRVVFGLQRETCSQDLVGSNPSLESTVEFQTSNDDGKKFEEKGRNGTNFIEVTDGRSDILVGGFEERVELDGLFGDEHTEDGKHGDASVLELGFAIVLDLLEVGIGCETCGVELTDRGERSGKSKAEGLGVGCPAIEILEGGGGLGSLLRGEGGNGSDEGGSESDLHGGKRSKSSNCEEMGRRIFGPILTYVIVYYYLFHSEHCTRHPFL